MAEARPPLGAMVLAAGRATRMGRPKVLLPWRGRPLLAHVLAALAEAGIDPVVVVTGPGTPSLLGVQRPGDELECTFNPAAGGGMATSIAAGARALAGRVAGALVCLGDQPRVEPLAIRALAAHGGAGRPVVPLYRGRRGHPVLFPAALFPELFRLEGDRGARAVLDRYPPLAVPLDLPLPEDVDTEEDYARLLATAATGGR